MTTVEIGTAQFNDRGEVIAAEAPAPVIAGRGWCCRMRCWRIWPGSWWRGRGPGSRWR